MAESSSNETKAQEQISDALELALGIMLAELKPKRRARALYRIEALAEQMRNEALDRCNVYPIRGGGRPYPLTPERMRRAAAAASLVSAVGFALDVRPPQP